MFQRALLPLVSPVPQHLKMEEHHSTNETGVSIPASDDPHTPFNPPTPNTHESCTSQNKTTPFQKLRPHSLSPPWPIWCGTTPEPFGRDHHPIEVQFDDTLPHLSKGCSWTPLTLKTNYVFKTWSTGLQEDLVFAFASDLGVLVSRLVMCPLT